METQPPTTKAELADVLSGAAGDGPINHGARPGETGNRYAAFERDVHPENFGVMPSADNVPMFGVNDFDEAHSAPFTWDIKRGATGFMLAAAQEGVKSKKQRKIVKHFVKGYIEGISGYAANDDETSRQLRFDNAPAMIRERIDDALEDRNEWLADDYHEEYRCGFRAGDELVPITSRVEEFQELIDRWRVENDIVVPRSAARSVVWTTTSSGSSSSRWGRPNSSWMT